MTVEILVTITDASATDPERIRRGVMTALSNGYPGYANFTARVLPIQK